MFVKILNINVGVSSHSGSGTAGNVFPCEHLVKGEFKQNFCLLYSTEYV